MAAITLAGTTICTDATRSVDGAPVGPGNVSGQETPGVSVRDYVGSARCYPEAVRCAHGTLSFQTTRVFASAAAATAFAFSASGLAAEPVEGELKYDTTTIFAHACVTARSYGMTGCTVIVRYTLEG